MTKPLRPYIVIPVEHNGDFYWKLGVWLERLPSILPPYYRDTVPGGPVAVNRNQCVHRFLTTDADFFWTVDADMDPNIEGYDCGGATLIMEAMERDDVDIVSGISFRIGDGPVPCVSSTTTKQDVVDRVFDKPPGLHELRGISTGGACLAVKRHVIEDFWKRGIPWFKDNLVEGEPNNPELGKLKSSEDLHFIRTAQELGHRFWVDTRIEWGHMKRQDLRDELKRAKELMARAGKN